MRCILGDIRRWVGDPSTCSCLVSLPRVYLPKSQGQNLVLTVSFVPYSEWFATTRTPRRRTSRSARFPPPGAAVLGLVFDHFPKSCGPSEYHLRSIKRLKRGFGAKRGQLEGFEGLLPENQGQNLVVTVLCALYSLDSGITNFAFSVRRLCIGLLGCWEVSGVVLCVPYSEWFATRRTRRRRRARSVFYLGLCLWLCLCLSLSLSIDGIERDRERQAEIERDRERHSHLWLCLCLSLSLSMRREGRGGAEGQQCPFSSKDRERDGER